MAKEKPDGLAAGVSAEVVLLMERYANYTTENVLELTEKHLVESMVPVLRKLEELSDQFASYQAETDRKQGRSELINAVVKYTGWLVGIAMLVERLLR